MGVKSDSHRSSIHGRETFSQVQPCSAGNRGPQEPAGASNSILGGVEIMEGFKRKAILDVDRATETWRF